MNKVNKNTRRKTVTVIPAYGRDYKSKEEVRTAWNEGKDFKIVGIQGNGTYINKEDADRFNVQVRIRYANKTKLITLK